MTRPTTFPEAFQQTVAAHPDELALRTPDDAVSLTWREYGEEVRRIAGGLAALGLKPGDTFLSMLANRPQFNLTEVAASHVGATTYSCYNTSSPEQINYLLTHADTKIAVTEQQFVGRIEASGVELDHLLVLEEGDVDKLQPAVDFDFEARWRAVRPTDGLCLIYTSGTTGNPKGVEHTHGGVLRLIESLETYWPMEAGDTTISYLPSSHAADRFFGHYYPIAKGAQVTSVADPTKLPQVLGQVRPTTFVAVPRIWEKLKFGVERQLSADEKLAAAFEAGVPQVVDAVRAKVGFDRLKWALSGAAAIPPPVYAFMQKLGLPVVEMWGMSECLLGTGTTPAEAKIGTIGKIAPGAEAKVLDDGELLVRMPWLMRGYRKDPAKTAEAIDDDGWLHTGDVVAIDDEGYFKIVDRKKELIINSGGKNMSPSNIEGAIVSRSPLIGSVMAIGDGRPYNVALITLDVDATPVFAEKLGLEPDPAVLAKDPRVVGLVQQAVDEGNETLSRIEQVKRFTILPTFWEAGGDEMTPTSKLKRRPISEKYAAQIDELYARSDA